MCIAKSVGHSGRNDLTDIMVIQYTEYSKDTGVDYVAKPKKVATDPYVAVDVACWYWDKRKLNRFADKDDVKQVTRRINGGYNGLDDRIDYLTRAKAVLGIK